MVRKHELKAGETNKRPIPRCMLYYSTGSKVFTGEVEIKAARKAGWEDEPAEPTAQAAGAAAFDEAAAARILELEEQLEAVTSEVDEATELAVNAEAEAKSEGKRADAAEKKLAAAEKKIAASASK